MLQDTPSRAQAPTPVGRALVPHPEVVDVAASPRRLDSGLTLQTVTCFEDAEAIAPEWEELITQLGGSLYMSFAWCRVWWRHYGAGRDLRLIAVRAGEALVGMLPLFIDKLWLPAPARIAKLLGSDSTLAVVELPIELDVVPEAIAMIVERLLVEDRVDVIHFGPCSGALPQLEALRLAAASLTGVAELVRDRESGSHTVFQIPEGFDAYVRALKRNHRSNYKRRLAKLTSTFNFKVEVVSDPDVIDSEFEAFIEMHQAQWKAVGKLGHFGDWPGSREFSIDLVRTLAGADRVRLIRLLADERVVAYSWCFFRQGAYYWRLPARLMGEEWDQFALGRVAVMKMIEAAAAEGATAVEAGPGRYDYKEQLNATTLPLYSLALSRSGIGPRLRARLTLAYADLLHLVYYRVWYIRVAPRLPLLRRPLRRSWIRRRI